MHKVGRTEHKQQAVTSAAGNGVVATLLCNLVAKTFRLDCCAAHSPLLLAFSAEKVERECHFNRSSVDIAAMHERLSMHTVMNTTTQL